MIATEGITGSLYWLKHVNKKHKTKNRERWQHLGPQVRRPEAQGWVWLIVWWCWIVTKSPKQFSSLWYEDNSLPDMSGQHTRPFKDSPQALDKLQFLAPLSGLTSSHWTLRLPPCSRGYKIQLPTHRSARSFSLPADHKLSPTPASLFRSPVYPSSLHLDICCFHTSHHPVRPGSISLLHNLLRLHHHSHHTFLHVFVHPTR